MIVAGAGAAAINVPTMELWIDSAMCVLSSPSIIYAHCTIRVGSSVCTRQLLNLLNCIVDSTVGLTTSRCMGLFLACGLQPMLSGLARLAFHLASINVSSITIWTIYCMNDFTVFITRSIPMLHISDVEHLLVLLWALSWSRIGDSRISSHTLLEFHWFWYYFIA